MNASQIHLALTHVPVILSFIGLVILIVSLFRKNDTLTKTSFYILISAALFVLPVYFTGEGAEEIVENLPGVSESLIERHEESAKIALILILAGGIVSLTGLVLYKRAQMAKFIKTATLLFALVAAVTMVQTAHLGGQIRHTEIRSSFVTTNENENTFEEKDEKESGINEQNTPMQKTEKKDDDD